MSAAIFKFDACYQAARGGQPYTVDGWKDGKAIKGLSPKYTPPIVEAMIVAYFADDSSFWATKARSIAMFVRWLNDEASAGAFGRALAGKPIVEEDDAYERERRAAEAQRERTLALVRKCDAYRASKGRA